MVIVLQNVLSESVSPYPQSLKRFHPIEVRAVLANFFLTFTQLATTKISAALLASLGLSPPMVRWDIVVVVAQEGRGYSPRDRQGRVWGQDKLKASGTGTHSLWLGPTA